MNLSQLDELNFKTQTDERGQNINFPYSINELARFWDEHDITDFEDALEEVTDPVFIKDDGIEIHLQPDEMKSLQKLARQKGLQSKELIRQWILEKL